MSDSPHHSKPTTSPEPFEGDRGWKSLERTPDELVMFAAVVALLAVAVLAALIGGAVGVGMLFVVLSFLTLAILVLMSVG